MVNAVRSFVRVNRLVSERLLQTFPSIFGGPSYGDDLKYRIEDSIKKNKPSVVLEAGGTDRPILMRNSSYKYVGVDIESQPDCVHLYDQFIVQSIEDPLQIRADIIVSITLLEHVPNNTKSVVSMFDCLLPGGYTHHYIPSAFHPYSIALRMIGPKLQRKLIPLLRPGTEGVTGYPAFFDKCTPTAMTEMFEQSGFTEISVVPFLAS